MHREPREPRLSDAPFPPPELRERVLAVAREELSARRAAKQRRRPQWGWSVAVAVSLLAGLLFPVLATARARVRRIVCLSQLQQLDRAHQLYLQDWDGRFPHWVVAAPLRPPPFGRYRFWPEYLAPYLRDSGIFRDPKPASLGADELRLADYALVTWENQGRGAGSRDNPYFRWPGPSLTQAEVKRPAETIILADGYTSARRESAVELDRHEGGLQVSFLDGHLRWLSAGEFQRVDTDGRGFYWLHYGTSDR